MNNQENQGFSGSQNNASQGQIQTWKTDIQNKEHEVTKTMN